MQYDYVEWTLLHYVDLNLWYMLSNLMSINCLFFHYSHGNKDMQDEIKTFEVCPWPQDPASSGRLGRRLPWCPTVIKPLCSLFGNIRTNVINDIIKYKWFFNHIDYFTTLLRALSVVTVVTCWFLTISKLERFLVEALLSNFRSGNCSNESRPNFPKIER